MDLVILIFVFCISLLMICNVKIKPIHECGHTLYPPSDTNIRSHSEWTRNHYRRRIKSFQRKPVQPDSIVLIGDSLTELGGNWSDKLNLPHVYNRGISGDNTDGVLMRLGEIVCAKPRMVFIMIGTNDLWTNEPAQEVGTKIDSIGTILSEELPQMAVYIQTIMPIESGHDSTDRLIRMNESIRSYKGRGYQIIDTYKEMANTNGALPTYFTDDGVHLTELAYKKWALFLKSQIDKKDSN